jgi:hypothetical protein
MNMKTEEIMQVYVGVTGRIIMSTGSWDDGRVGSEDTVNMMKGVNIFMNALMEKAAEDEHGKE